MLYVFNAFVHILREQTEYQFCRHVRNETRRKRRRLRNACVWLCETKLTYANVRATSVFRIRANHFFFFFLRSCRVGEGKKRIAFWPTKAYLFTLLRCTYALPRYAAMSISMENIRRATSIARFVSFRCATHERSRCPFFSRKRRTKGVYGILTSYRSWMCGPACAMYSVLAVSNTNSCGILVTLCRAISWQLR